MAEHFSIVLIWSKGAQQRQRILLEIGIAEDKKVPIFVSKLAEILVKQIHGEDSDLGTISATAVRNHVAVLKKYEFVEPLNAGGKPEYLRLTEIGRKAVKLLHSSS